MKLGLGAIEKLAPDQASLKAAAGLAKPGPWSQFGCAQDESLIWGACAGSGANPYRVVADLGNLGTKCTCPSRKFPCKHALALLWLRAEGKVSFAAGETPDWVADWLGRRRKPADDAASAKEAPPKDLNAAQSEAASDAEPQDTARRRAASEKRAGETRAAILDALDALDQWIGDQLRLGLAAFLDDAVARCRRIAARLVDGKAPILAGRLDELPSQLLALPVGDRVRGTVVELGKLVTLARAFRAHPEEPEMLRAVAAAETRESVLSNPATLKIAAPWEVLGEEITTRRDGLVSRATWLLNLGETAPRFAMLLDHFPASGGRLGSVFSAGEQFEAEIAFYPAQRPLRALLLKRSGDVTAAGSWPVSEAPLAGIAQRLAEQPWVSEIPILLPAGRVAFDNAGQGWWRGKAAGPNFRLATPPHGLVRATDLERSAAIWSVGGIRLLAAQTAWGRIDCVG